MKIAIKYLISVANCNSYKIMENYIPVYLSGEWLQPKWWDDECVKKFEPLMPFHTLACTPTYVHDFSLGAYSLHAVTYWLLLCLKTGNTALSLKDTITMGASSIEHRELAIR